MRDTLHALIEQADNLPELSDAEFEEFCRLWHRANEAVKDAIFAGPAGKHSQFNRQQFENTWGAQSVVFMADMLPFIHAKLVQHYRRPQVLKALDVGAASGFGSRFLASLHLDHSIYSRIEVEAIDLNPTRKRWVQATAPEVRFTVADLFKLQARSYDLVVCSHVVEHVSEPRPFIEKLREVCRGFAFVYTPYNESPRIKAHRATITEADYDGLPCEFHRIKSMGWHPNRPDDYCLLAVMDCR